MNYKNANSILPDRLIQEVQQYVQGEYIYIPIKDKVPYRIPTDYRQELIKRNEHIYTKSIEGVSTRKLAEMCHLSPSSIRRIIIGQRKRYETMISRIKKIITQWDVDGAELEQIHDSAWLVGNNAVLKIYEDDNMLQRNMRLLITLEELGIPVGNIILTENKKNYVQDDKYFYILTKRLSGNNITDVHENATVATMTGTALARLHKAFRECELKEDFWNNSLLGEMKSWVRDIFEKNDWKYIQESQFDATVEVLESVYDKLPVQLIHRDVHLGNFLFDKGNFSGYIDFDLSQRNIRIFDLCYFMAGLLSSKEMLDISEEQWFDTLQYFFAGYESESRLLSEEKWAVPSVMKSIELLFVAWFVEQKDIRCAEDAMKIYRFVEKNQEAIIKIIL